MGQRELIDVERDEKEGRTIENIELMDRNGHKTLQNLPGNQFNH
jgi:hypothetical protein